MMFSMTEMVGSSWKNWKTTLRLNWGGQYP